MKAFLKVSSIIIFIGFIAVSVILQPFPEVKVKQYDYGETVEYEVFSSIKRHLSR